MHTYVAVVFHGARTLVCLFSCRLSPSNSITSQLCVSPGIPQLPWSTDRLHSLRGTWHNINSTVRQRCQSLWAASILIEEPWKIRKPFIFFTQAAARAFNPSVASRYCSVGSNYSRKKKYRFSVLFIHCLYENGLNRTVSRLSSDSESEVWRKVWGHSDPVGLILCKKDQRRQNPFDLKPAVCLKIQFLTVIMWNYVGELWAAVLKGLSPTVLSILCFCFTLYLDSFSSPSIINSHAADLLAWEYCFFPFTQLIIQRDETHKQAIGRPYWQASG